MDSRERAAVAAEIAKNLLMGSRVVAALRSRTSSGRMPIGRSDLDASHAHTRYVWARYAAALRAAGLVPDDSGSRDSGRDDSGRDDSGSGGWWRGKTTLEIGPGTHLGIQLLLVAEGVTRADALDRFGGVLAGEDERQLYRRLLDGQPPEGRQRVEAALSVNADRVAFGDAVRYYRGVRLEDAPASITQRYDVILAHEAIEHVEHLDRGIQSVSHLLAPGGHCVFVCHLTSLGGVYNHESEPLRLLYYSDLVWSLMFSNRGGSNRVRASGYRDLLTRHGFEILSLSVLERLPAADLARVKPHFVRRFRDLPDDDLSILSFSVVARKA